MAIFRGPGGAGDATGDATNAAALAISKANEAAASATSAASSATAAASSATAASDSASTASTAASTATTKASEASTSATNAATSATAAQTAETNAETAEANAETAESNAATSASNASTSATNAASSASAASTSATSASTSATNASSSASSASTSATNAASSATAAASSATSASNSASAAATSETNAASSASSASTSATNAASSASSASTSASSASTSATNAANSASAASTSATNAASSETNAASSATAAASSASSAASSAASAAASLDSFDDRYLGSKTADPTVDNDGNALVTGALYYNSVDGEMRVYDGSQWIAASAASQAILTKYKYVATAGQTTFSGTDANSLTLAYTVGSIIVTLNGVVLNGADYTATTGTSVVLAVAASLNDELNVLAFSTFDVANTYTQAQSDAKYLTISNPSYTGTLTGGTGVVNLGSGQFYKDGSGNVGIGTSSPRSLLNAKGSGSTGAVLTLENSSTSVGSGEALGSLEFYSNDASTGGAGVKGKIASVDDNGFGQNYALTFSTGVATGGGNVLSEKMRIDSSGNLLVGGTSLGLTSGGFGVGAGSAAYANFGHASGTASGSEYAQFLLNGAAIGSIKQNGTTGVLFNITSDYRLKNDQQPLTGAKEFVMALQPKKWQWWDGSGEGVGFIAHEFMEVAKYSGNGEKDAIDADGNPVYQSIQPSSSEVMANIVALLQEQQAIINDLKTRIETLENK